MKECDYCGRENEDDAVYCRECGTAEFKNDPPPVPTRISIADFVKDCAASIDELASSGDMLLSWMMAAWIATVSLRLLSREYTQAMLYAGLRTAWWQNVAAPLLIGATFVLAPLVGAYCIVRWLRRRKERMILNLMAWMLLAFFVGIFCLVWIVFWDGSLSDLFSFARAY